ncbi:hypothetical protein ATANTOWER_022283 [Ataeniobius toweri]|uniref:PDZ domain-containing protein n=1 Tax=Ataeniobius toweri TaxID=208326 RepID=A0ABU7CI41_9TELE|nr:hypothetical protein [Ataeniobius toweri]
MCACVRVCVRVCVCACACVCAGVEAGVRTVEITRGAGDSLGVSVAGGKGSPLGDIPIFIAMIQANGVAAKTHRLKVGDRIVSVGGQSVDGLSHSEVVTMLKNSYGNISLQVVGVHPVTGGLPVRTPAMSVSVIVSLGKTLHSPCLLMVVRGPGGADCMAAPLQSVWPRGAVATM